MVYNFVYGCDLDNTYETSHLTVDMLEQTFASFTLQIIKTPTISVEVVYFSFFMYDGNPNHKYETS